MIGEVLLIEWELAKLAALNGITPIKPSKWDCAKYWIAGAAMLVFVVGFSYFCADCLITIAFSGYPK